MPYIDKDGRVGVAQSGPTTVGELTYAFQQEISEYLAEQGLFYQSIAECLGALEGAKLDFIERVVKPYEERKRIENGDVWQYSQVAGFPTEGTTELLSARQIAQRRGAGGDLR